MTLDLFIRADLPALAAGHARTRSRPTGRRGCEPDGQVFKPPAAARDRRASARRVRADFEGMSQGGHSGNPLECHGRTTDRAGRSSSVEMRAPGAEVVQEACSSLRASDVHWGFTAPVQEELLGGSAHCQNGGQGGGCIAHAGSDSFRAAIRSSSVPRCLASGARWHSVEMASPRLGDALPGVGGFEFLVAGRGSRSTPRPAPGALRRASANCCKEGATGSDR